MSSSTQRNAGGNGLGRLLLLPAVALVVLIGAGWAVRHWRRPPAAPARIAAPGTARGKNVLLVTLDTLRADRLGCYGYDMVETPVIDRLAEEGVRFAHAVTAVPMTLPSHCTMMTGLYPPNHGVRDNGLFRLSSEHITLAETLKQHNYTTAAFVAAFVLDARYGLDLGFDHYDDDLTLRHRLPTPTPPHNPERPANVVVDSALAWLEAAQVADSNRPFFLWVHLFDPHLPYAPPEPFRSRYRDRPYDGEIAFLDEQVGRLMTALERLGLADSTVTVLVGDHGEGLGDHGEATHRQLIYGSTMRVPLIMHGPGTVAPGQVVDDAAVGTVDVMPTVLDLLGLDALEHCDGRSVLSGGLDPQRVHYMETLSPQLNDGWAPLFGLRRVSDKYIDAPAPEYFDLAADPGELSNLWSARQEAGDALALRLDELRATFPVMAQATSVVPSPEEARQLQALGYLGGTMEAGGGGSDLDPKVMIHSFNARLAAIDLMRRGRNDEALASLQALVSESPDSAELWSLLGRAQESLGRFPEAVSSVRKATELQPSNPEYYSSLSLLMARLGDDRGADDALARAERLDPGWGRAWLIRAHRAVERGEDDEALRCCSQAVAIDPVRCAAEGYALAGLIYQRRGRADEAVAAFDAALEHDPRNGTALLATARIVAAAGEPRRAMNLLALLIDGQPEFVDGGRLLGRLYFDAGDPDVAASIFGELLRRNPHDGAAHVELSRVLASRGRIDEALDHLEQAAVLGMIDFDTVRSDPSFQSLANHPRWRALEATGTHGPQPRPGGR